MPYDRLDELPPAVRKLPRKRQRQWKNVWNSVYGRCTERGGDPKECERRAFASAWAAVGGKVKAQDINSEETSMESEKAMAGAVYLEIPITKIDEEQRIVEGIATAEVLDSQGDIVDFPSAVEAFKAWEGNIREQHDPKKAVGRAVEWKPIEESKAIRLAARISKGAQDTWEKVKDKTLRYFSIGAPFGGYERKPEIIKTGDEEKTVNRLFLKTLSEVSLVDVGANPLARIELVKADGARTEILAEDEPVEKLTEGASDYADPGWQPDGKKRYPLDTPEHVRAAAVYFARKRNRAKYTAEQQKKIDARIRAAKKKFKIGEFAEKAAADFACLSKEGNEVPWVPMNEAEEGEEGAIRYVPRTFADVYEDVELQEDMPKMIEVLKRCLENILISDLSNREKRDLMMQTVQEFFDELDEELAEGTEEAKAAESSLEKIGARNSKADLARIQGIHDHAVDLGAVCKPAKSAAEEASETIAKLRADCEAALAVAERAKAAIDALGGIEKLAAGPDMEKVAEAARAEAAAVKSELEAKLADQEAKLAKVQEHEGELAKVKADLEAVKKQPALPIVRPEPKVLELVRGSAAKEDDNPELAALIKARDATTDPVAREALNRQISLIEIKATLRKR